MTIEITLSFVAKTYSIFYTACVTMCAAVFDTIGFTCVVVFMISLFACRDLAVALVITCTCRRIERAVLAARSAMGIVVLADVFLASLSFLLAYIANALLVDACASRTYVLDSARLACAAIDTTCRVVLRTRTLPVKRIETESLATCRGNADAIFAFSRFPSWYLAAIGFTRATSSDRIGNADIAFDVGIGFAGFGFAYLVFADAPLGILDCIAVDSCRCLTVGTCSCAVDFARAIRREVVAVGACCNDTCAVLAITCRGVVCCATV